MAGGLSDRRGFSNRWLVGQAWVQQVVVKQIGCNPNHMVRKPGWCKDQQIYHFNLLKKWFDAECIPPPLSLCLPTETGLEKGIRPPAKSKTYKG